VLPVPALDLHGPLTAGEWDLLAAALDDFSIGAVHETGTDDAPRWRVFFRDQADRDRAAAAIATSFPALTLAPALVEDEDWARRSQAELRAIQVGCLIVAPPWDTPDTSNAHLAPSAPGAPSAPFAPDALSAPSAPDPILITILPSTGFGTGHHETTRLCLSLLQDQEVDGRIVLDVGTGSGVLAIAAWLLGARHVTAIDSDPEALENTRENAALNGLWSDDGGTPVLTIVHADLRELNAPADLVLANLTGALLVGSAAHLAAQVQAGGVLIASGFLEHEADAVIRALGAASLARIVARRHEGEWHAVAVRRG
jgi:ribosomal protein L11 methyltransferase